MVEKEVREHGNLVDHVRRSQNRHMALRVPSQRNAPCLTSSMLPHHVWLRNADYRAYSPGLWDQKAVAQDYRAASARSRRGRSAIPHSLNLIIRTFIRKVVKTI